MTWADEHADALADIRAWIEIHTHYEPGKPTVVLPEHCPWSDEQVHDGLLELYNVDANVVRAEPLGEHYKRIVTKGYNLTPEDEDRIAKLLGRGDEA